MNLIDTDFTYDLFIKAIKKHSILPLDVGKNISYDNIYRNNRATNDIRYYLDIFKNDLIIEEDQLNLIMELINTQDDSNCLIALGIIENLKLKE